MNSKDRLYLRKIASNEKAIFQIGKNDISDETVFQIDNALKARELIKVKILKNSMCDIKYAAEYISEKTNSEIVSIIGNNIILFKESEKKKIFGS